MSDVSIQGDLEKALAKAWAHLEETWPNDMPGCTTRFLIAQISMLGWELRPHQTDIRSAHDDCPSETEPNSRGSGRKTMTVTEAGEYYFGLSRNASYEAAKRGDIPTIRIGRRIFVPIAAMERLLRRSPFR